jgi:hypothetical protein
MSDVIEKLKDLHKQATVNRSHYYTGSVISEAIVELARLRELQTLVREWQEARAEATKTTDEYLRQVRPSAFAIVRLTQAEQALSAWRPT